jgi:hypothetical protein
VRAYDGHQVLGVALVGPQVTHQGSDLVFPLPNLSDVSASPAWGPARGARV